MHVGITGDCNAESGVVEVVLDLRTRTRVHFAPLDYGPGLAGVGICLLCRDPALNLKRRVFQRKSTGMLYIDIMLHLPEFVGIEQEERRQKVIHALIRDVPETIAKYKFKNFDLARFTTDWTAWLSTLPPEQPRDPNAPLVPPPGGWPHAKWSKPTFTRG